ncbi:MAG: hypothetical protein RL204_1366 [Bacteroidota bacterium]|jgi:hypothetical protein
MKITLSIFAFLACLVANATIRTVNNQSGSDADFTSITSAMGASLDGDTIYIQPSPTIYGSITVTKRLVIMGAGHNPNFSLYNSALDIVTFGNNSSNSIFKGLNIAQITTTNSTTVNNLLFSGCFLTNYNGNPIALNSGVYNNWIFEGNIIKSYGTNINISGLGSNAIFRNNYISSTVASTTLTNIPSGTIFDHNIISQFFTSSASSTGVGFGTNVYFSNNIITTQASTNYGASYSCSQCTFDNNILWNYSSAYLDVPGSNNLVNVDPDFNAFVWDNNYSYNNDFHVAADSPATNAATDGTDIGIYGGIFNFNPFGIDGGTPHIVDFSLESSTVPQGGTITIHLNANGSGQ